LFWDGLGGKVRKGDQPPNGVSRDSANVIKMNPIVTNVHTQLLKPGGRNTKERRVDNPLNELGKEEKKKKKHSITIPHPVHGGTRGNHTGPSRRNRRGGRPETAFLGNGCCNNLRRGRKERGERPAGPRKGVGMVLKPNLDQGAPA